jgi:hypothetical protein
MSCRKAGLWIPSTSRPFLLVRLFMLASNQCIPTVGHMC